MSQQHLTTPTPVNEPVLSYRAGSPERLAVETELAAQKNTVIEVPLFIDGQEVFTSQKDELKCPHNHKHTLARVSRASHEHVSAAIDSNLKARKKWANLPWQARAAVFLKAADLLAGPLRAKINAATMLGQSKTVHQAEIDAACELIDFFRFNAHFMEKIMSEQPISGPGMWNRSQVRGLEGFVYAVSPFNFTSIAVNLPAAPAMMGCAVLWKPAPTSMHAAWVGMQVLKEAGLPDGVINMIPGDPETISKVVIAHPELSGLHFTGSTQTFNLLWQQMGQNIQNYRHYPRIVGETGGKDFIFAHQSADVPALVTALIRGAFEFQGQKCSAASRAYIPKSLWPQVKPLLIKELESVKVGDIEDFSNFMGAVIDQRAFKKITTYIEAARASGNAEIIFGGNYSDEVGYFIDPTVVETTDPHFTTMKEEIFGPVLTIFPYENENFEETLTLCDQTSPYALTGAIFAQDRQVIEHMADRLKEAAGNFYINDKPTGAVVGQQPFGGARASGTNDKAGSPFNLLRWASHRTIKETFAPPHRFPYPYMEG